MTAPFSYFGGKSRIASRVWALLGNPPNFIEPFCGSCAVLLARPDTHAWWDRIETVNDANGLLSNFWRAVQADPDAVARYADWPVIECDLSARHAWLVAQRDSVQSRLEGDPDWYDAKTAGWWLWGVSLWIGSGWCSGEGPWQQVDGLLVKAEGDGVTRQLPSLGNAGQGVSRKRPSPSHSGKGISQAVSPIGDRGEGVCETWSAHIRDMMRALSDRLRRVRVCCGDWSRICGPAPTVRNGLTGVFLDPPYSHAERYNRIYATEMVCADAVREWAIAQGDDPRMRIVLCGYDGEHALPASWREIAWTGHGGYAGTGNGAGRANRKRERLWASPHCLADDLFAGTSDASEKKGGVG